MPAEHLLEELSPEEQLKAQLLALQRKKLELAKSNGLAFYRPHIHQDAFHRAGNFKFRLAEAGNRGGKSTMGVAEDCGWLQGARIWYPRTDPAYTLGIPQRPVKGLVIAADWDKVDEIFTSQRGEGGKLWKFLPRGSVRAVRRNPGGVIDSVELTNDSELRFDTVQSFKHNPLSQESSHWDFIHVDEPCPEEQWKANARGLVDTNGSAWFTLTPLNNLWMHDMFYPRYGAEKTQLWKNTHWAIRWSMLENPHLPPEAIKSFEATLTEDERQCRIQGIPLELSGLVYKEFNWDRHVLKEVPKEWADFNTPPKEWPIYYAIDPHPQTPHAVLFLTVSPHEQVIVFDEIWAKVTIRELCDLILIKTSGRNIIRAKVDPLAKTRDPINDTCMMDEFWKNGVYVDEATKAKAHGIMRVGQELKAQNRLFFAPNLRRTLWEMARYCYDKENKPVDKDDHMMENLYRLVLEDPFWVPPSSDQSGVVVRDLEIARPDFSLS